MYAPFVIEIRNASREEAVDMALLNPTFIFGIFVLLYLSSFILFAILRIITGISIQRIGYFSLRRLAYTPKDGMKIEIRGLGLNMHRPTFAQPTWLSIVVNELAITVDLKTLHRIVGDDDESEEEGEGRGQESNIKPQAEEKEDRKGSKEDKRENSTAMQYEYGGEPGDRPRIHLLRRATGGIPRSETWRKLMHMKDRIKRLHRNVNWLRMVDVVATNSTVSVVDVGSIQCGSFTIAVDTRRKMVDRARFFLQRNDRRRQKQQAEWIMTVRSVLFTAEGKESLEVIDNATLNIHGYLYEALDGLRDAAIALKFGRVHIPYNDAVLCSQMYKKLTNPYTDAESVEVSINTVIQELGDPGSTDHELMQAVSDSKEFFSSILRGIKEVQFAVSFLGITKKVDSVKPAGAPVLLTASMKEVGIDLHRLDPKSPAHRMYFPSKDIAHEALAAALSISIGVDDGQGKPERIVYIPMATTTVKTTLPSKTVQLSDAGSLSQKNANILFANSVVTSPSVDLDPRHLPLLLTLLRPRHSSLKSPSSTRSKHILISRLLPKANIKFSMHEPVIRVSLPPVEPTADPDDFDLIISSISSISLDVESFHSEVEDLHYSLASSMRLQSHNLYYQTSSSSRFNLMQTESFDMKLNLSASPDVHVVANGNLQTFSVKMVRPEITDGLRQIFRQLRLDVGHNRHSSDRHSQSQNLLRKMPSWLLQFQIQAHDFSVEVAGIDDAISDETRGIALTLDSWTGDYRAQRLDGLNHRRQPSRRRTRSRSLTPDSDFLRNLPVSPKKMKQKTPGDGRRLTLSMRGMETFIVEACDKWEIEPFVTLPKLEVSLSTSSDNHGPVFHIHSQLRTLSLHYSLYRHYAVGVAVMVLKKAFVRTSHDTDDAHNSKYRASNHFLSPPSSPDFVGDSYNRTEELTTADIRATLVQVKFEMPNDPPVMLHVYDLDMGAQRWSPPFARAKIIRLYVEAPRMHGVWARVVSIKSLRLEHRVAQKRHASVRPPEGTFDINTEAIRVSVPHEVIVHKITDNFVNVFKSAQQLHHKFGTSSNDQIRDKGPEGPKKVPRVSIRSRSLLFELEDGAFEWKLGMIYRAGRIEQVQRLAREEAFRLKVKKIHEEESRKENRHRNRSAMARGRARQGGAGWVRSHSEEGRPRRSMDDSERGRTPRYDPDGEAAGMSGNSRVSMADARHNLHVLNAQSWKKRIEHQYSLARNDAKELRGELWGHDELPDDMEESEHILEIPERAGLLSALVTDLQFDLDKPNFPLKDLPEYLHQIGKGMPRDMKYSLLVPMHVQIGMGEAKLSLRDYPLPFIHVPALKPGQAFKHSFHLKTNFVIAEEYHGPESTRKIKINVIPQRSLAPDANPTGSYPIYVRRTIGPVKTYSDISVDVNTAHPTRITWCPSFQPAMQDMMMVMESFTKPQLDRSERAGFWDKIRLNFHSRMRIAWKGDGDVHLALKGTRDPYLVTGHGAGLLMCWRNDVRLGLNTEDDPKRLLSVNSGEYILAIPDFSQQVRDSEKRYNDKDSFLSDESYRQGASFQKVVMKLSGKVQWLAGLVFEQAIRDGVRRFDFKPHYDVVLKAPEHAKDVNGEPYDAFRGFRSQHIHLSLDIRAPVDREWMSDNSEPSRSYNTTHFTPRFFTHFFAWWSLFGGPLSLPIRQGSLWPGREKNSKKFGRHLGTIKYNLLLAPLFLSHIYKHKDLDEHVSEDNAVSATGIKVRFDSFMLDIHQRREEFNTQDRGRKTQSRTTGMKIHAAQLDLVSADVRAVSASIKGTAAEAIKSGSMSALLVDPDDDAADLSHFTIPDNDFSWVDMDDFVELDWILPSGACPDTKILPLACAPRVTYFRQTDIGGVIAGDPDRTSPFGQEPTHLCIMSQDDPRQVQTQLIEERLEQLMDQMENHDRNLGEAELKGVRSDWNDEALRREFDALIKHTNVLQGKKDFLMNMLRQMNSKIPTVDTAEPPPGPRDEAASDMSIEFEGGGNMKLPSGAQFASDFNNRFVVHNLQLKWNNLLRNIVLRYIHQVSQRRGFVYYLSRPAVKFILDIVEEQAKAKTTKAETSATSTKSSTAPTEAASSQKEETTDIEDRIRKILAEGRKFVDSEDPQSEEGGTMEDLTGGIADEFTPQNSFHVRLIAPQIQLQSEKNKKLVVLVAAKGMELKVVEVMDKDRISDMVSGIVQRRMLLQMDGAQFFVTHQKWFSKQLLSMYSGSTYGAPVGTSWPPWVPMEVMFDFNADPFGFKRVVQKTSATLRYDKYNTLRLKYNDEVNSDGTNASSPDNPESRMDNLWVEFPQVGALCNSSQYYAMFVIGTDLLMYSEPLEKTRSERLEKIMLASDFSDLRGTPELVTKLQERIRQLEEIKTHFQTHSNYLDKMGWEDRLLLERDLAGCEDELFFMMKAITTSQRKYDTTAQSNALLRWSIAAKEIVWHLIRDTNEPLVELQLKDVEYDRTDNSDGSHINLFRVGRILGLNLLPDAMYPEMIAPYMEADKGSLSVLNMGLESREMIRVYWYMLEDIAGIPVMDQFEVSLFPLKIQLEREVGKKIFEYIFPDTSEANMNNNNSPSGGLQRFYDEDAEVNVAGSGISISDKDSFSTRPGSLELRLKPTLHSDALPIKTKALSTYSSDTNVAAPSFRERWFRSSASSQKAVTKKRSIESLSSFASVKPGGVSRTPTLHSKDSTSNNSNDQRRVSRFTLKSTKPAAEDQPSDDLTKMMSRASNFMTFAYIKMPSVVLCLSYKGKGERNIEDVHDFVFRLPTIEYRNKTWSNLDLALALKSRVLKALLSHTGAIIGNKFSKHRPGAAQQSRLRELATNSVLLATPVLGRGGTNGGDAASTGGNESQNSDDSSSGFGMSPVDFSRSPPRSLRNSQASVFNMPSSTSRSSSVASGRSYRTNSTGDSVAGPARPHINTTGIASNITGPQRGRTVPTFLMMTPPTPVDRPSTSAGLGISASTTALVDAPSTSTARPVSQGAGSLLDVKDSDAASFASGVSGMSGPGRDDTASILSGNRRRNILGSGTGEKIRGRFSAFRDRFRDGSSAGSVLGAGSGGRSDVSSSMVPEAEHELTGSGAATSSRMPIPQPARPMTSDGLGNGAGEGGGGSGSSLWGDSGSPQHIVTITSDASNQTVIGPGHGSHGGGGGSGSGGPMSGSGAASISGGATGSGGGNGTLSGKFFSRTNRAKTSGPDPM
ncbi:hypothetical protein MKZ38_004452 [Zalerion maritima]|uniref:Uncharacterized protein n=1 Tax=Zalerion maritima TaxID=339359 RepID=A0AAD5WWW9_9PEZI|nr:hypothetical protein MKZ38_004452 [Zalerion maritima]